MPYTVPPLSLAMRMRFPLPSGRKIPELPRSESTTGSHGQFVLSCPMQAKVHPSFCVNCLDHKIRPESISSATMASLVLVEGSE